MRGGPDHSQEQPSSHTCRCSRAPTRMHPERADPGKLAALGREVLELVPWKQRDSLDAYRQAATDLSATLKVTGVRVTPRKLYYVALRLKWLAHNTTD